MCARMCACMCVYVHTYICMYLITLNKTKYNQTLPLDKTIFCFFYYRCYCNYLFLTLFWHTRYGKRTVQGIIKDGWNALARYYLNNFVDGTKQVYG